MCSPSIDVGVQGYFDGTCYNDSVLDTPIVTRIAGGKHHARNAGMEVNSPIECSAISVAAPIVSGFIAGAPRFEEVTQLINHYFAYGDIGVRFDQSIKHLVLSATQSQSVDGIEEVMQEWMVPDQLHEYELKQCKKKLRFESDSNEYVEKEK
ncbi:hypothetical protein ZWY2020_051032 [Hordeum vulgare]|nr:hypothetical protein ZWY2020_051032 [Hordeum vulgare]